MQRDATLSEADSDTRAAARDRNSGDPCLRIGHRLPPDDPSAAGSRSACRRTGSNGCVTGNTVPVTPARRAARRDRGAVRDRRRARRDPPGAEAGYFGAFLPLTGPRFDADQAPHRRTGSCWSQVMPWTFDRLAGRHRRVGARSRYSSRPSVPSAWWTCPRSDAQPVDRDLFRAWPAPARTSPSPALSAASRSDVLDGKARAVNCNSHSDRHRSSSLTMRSCADAAAQGSATRARTAMARMSLMDILRSLSFSAEASTPVQRYRHGRLALAGTTGRTRPHA